MEPESFSDYGLLSVEQAIGRLNLGRTKTYEFINSGRLRSVKVGARRLIPTSAIPEFIAGLDQG